MIKTMTISDYFRLEALTDQRHEYRDGAMVAAEPVTIEHSRISVKLTTALTCALRGLECEVFNSLMRVGIESTRWFVYPDAAILCGPPKFHLVDVEETTLVNPRVIFEITSETTEIYDRGEKFRHYRQSPSVEEYVLLAEDRPHVESLVRRPDGAWHLMLWEGLSAVARVQCIPLDLPLAEIYQGLKSTEVDDGVD